MHMLCKFLVLLFKRRILRLYISLYLFYIRLVVLLRGEGTFTLCNVKMDQNHIYTAKNLGLSKIHQLLKY